MQPFVRPFFRIDEDRTLFFSPPLGIGGRARRHYPMETVEQARHLANRAFWYCLPPVLLFFPSVMFFETFAGVMTENWGFWAYLLWLVPPGIALVYGMLVQGLLRRGLRAAVPGDARLVNDDEFRMILSSTLLIRPVPPGIGES